MNNNNPDWTDVDAELAKQGMRRATDGESGWYVTVSGGKIWATDAPPHDQAIVVQGIPTPAPVAPTTPSVPKATLFKHVARSVTVDEIIAFLEDTSVDQGARIVGALVWLKANREQMLEDESFSKFVDEHTRPAPNGGETAAETNRWPVILHNGVTHAVLATGGPADGSLYGMFTFCDLEVLDNQENPDWREVKNGQVTCEICKIGVAHEQKENKRLEIQVHEHVADYIAKNADALSGLKTTPEQPDLLTRLNSATPRTIDSSELGAAVYLMQQGKVQPREGVDFVKMPEPSVAPRKLSKTTLETLRHMGKFGGDVQLDKDDGKYYRSWGKLLKEDEIKWHRRHISTPTFEQLKPYLTNISDDTDTALGFTIYELNATGYRFLDDDSAALASESEAK